MKRVRRAFTRQFKLETVRMLIEGGKSVEEVSDELGVDAGVLRRWRRDLTAVEDGQTALRVQTEADELQRLRRENAQLRQERDLLKNWSRAARAIC
jgi:transposase